MKRKRDDIEQSNNKRICSDQTNSELSETGILAIPLEIWGEIFEFLAGSYVCHTSGIWYKHNETYRNLCRVNKKFLFVMRMSHGYPNLALFEHGTKTNYLAILPKKIKRLQITAPSADNTPITFLKQIPNSIEYLRVYMTNDLYDILNMHVFKNTQFICLTEVNIEFTTSTPRFMRLFDCSKCPNIKTLTIRFHEEELLKDTLSNLSTKVYNQLESLKLKTVCEIFIEQTFIPNMNTYTNLKCLYFDFYIYHCPSILVDDHLHHVCCIHDIVKKLPPNLHTIKTREYFHNLNVIQHIPLGLKKIRIAAPIITVDSNDKSWNKQIPSHLESVCISQDRNVLASNSTVTMIKELPNDFFQSHMKLKKLKLFMGNDTFDNMITDYHISAFPQHLQTVVISGWSIKDINCIYNKIKNFKLYNCRWILWKTYLAIARDKRRDDVMSSNSNLIRLTSTICAGKYIDRKRLPNQELYILHTRDLRLYSELLKPVYVNKIESPF